MTSSQVSPATDGYGGAAVDSINNLPNKLMSSILFSQDHHWITCQAKIENHWINDTSKLKMMDSTSLPVATILLPLREVLEAPLPIKCQSTATAVEDLETPQTHSAELESKAGFPTSKQLTNVDQ